MENMCRACMSFEKSENDFHDMELFEINNDEPITIAKMFHQSTTIVLDNCDGLPQKICPICFKELSDAFVFQQKCIKSDSELRSLFLMEIGSIENDEIKLDIYKCEDNNQSLNPLSHENDDNNEYDNDEIIEKPNPKNRRNASHPCEICKKVFDRKYRLARHLKVHERRGDQNEMNFECNVCNCLFASDDLLKRHFLIHNKIKSKGYKCPHCPRIFELKVSRSAHIKTHKNKNINSKESSNSTNKYQTRASSIITELIPDEHSNIIPEGVELIEIKKEDFQINVSMTLDDEQTLQVLSETNENLFDDEIFEKDCNETTNDNSNILKLDESDCSIEKPNPSNKRRAEHKCSVCDKIFDRKYRLNRHMSVHNSVNRPFECEICKWRFSHEDNLKRHKLLHTDFMSTVKARYKPGFFKCPGCPRKFEKRQSLSSHMRTHKKDNPMVTEKKFKCEICPKAFIKYNSLTRHLYTHDENKVFKCNLCEKAFALKGQLSVHISWHNGLKPYICEFCNKGFQQSCTLKDHLRTHTGERPFLCSECGKKFNNGSNLRQHILRHKGTKSYQCAECPSSFTCKGGLTSHMTTHTNLRPHVCDVCSSTFTKMYSLRKHKRIHTGEKPYSCDACSMRFTASNHLKRHMRTHTGEKPYSCKYCDRSFSQSNDLIKHLRSHVGEKVYQCEKCPMSFRFHAELRAHIQEHFKLDKKEEITISSDKNIDEIIIDCNILNSVEEEPKSS